MDETNRLNDLSIIIPALNEAKNIGGLVSALDIVASQLGLSFEILLIDGGSTDGTPSAAVSASKYVRVLTQQERGYGRALAEGFVAASGKFILTLDADLSHDPYFLKDFWEARNTAEMIIGSRYVYGGRATMPLARKGLSWILNAFFRKGLSLPYKDISSGFRLYRASLLRTLQLKSIDFEVLQEILIKTFANGWEIKEIPIHYKPRRSGSSHAKLIRFGIAYLKTFFRFWSLRNSVRSADYEDRAYDSRIPLQRYWQRKRYSIIEEFAEGKGLTLDVGCGSSRILSSKAHPVGVDIELSKLLYARRFGQPLVNASILSLPFRNQAFDCVICSGLIDQFACGSKPLVEIRRVLKPNGTLIISTPDYGHITWRVIKTAYERIVQGASRSHTTRYSFKSIKELLDNVGFRINKFSYILNSELIVQSTYAETSLNNETQI
ncbi:glycosyltransferase [bacterium]|nr:glycosyltransferase [bacterium]MCI0602924.1 glycosyltransferase [bacterium]